MASGSQNMTTYKAKNARNLLSLDTRASAIEPQSLDANNTALQLDFKQKSITGLTADYSGILSYRPYSSSGDWTGGPAHQIAFDTNGLHWHKSTNNTAWSSWRQLVTIADNTAAGGTTDPIYINASGEAVAITAGTTGQFYRGDKSWSNILVNHFLPGADNTYNLGSASTVWKVAYSRDFCLAANSKGYGDMYIIRVGTAGDGTNNGTYGRARLVLGNNIARSAENGVGANNARGELLLYDTNDGGGTYYAGAWNGDSSHTSFTFVGSTNSDAGSTGESWLILGNSRAKSADAASSTGCIRIYGDEAYRHDIYPGSPTGTRNHYLPNATGWIVTGGNGISTGAGDSDTPVYLKTDGTLAAITSYDGNAATATHLSSFPSNTTTFYRGDKTWTNTISNEFKIVRTTTDWKTGATLTFNTTMSSTTGYSYIASYQTPTATSYNDSLVIVATGGCFIGGGEGAETIHQNVMSGSGTEDLYLCPDGSIQIYTGADSKTHRATIDKTPSFYPATTETGNIGTSSYKWSNMYAVHFNGFATDVGDGSSMWIHPQSSDEINFGGTGGTKIYFGHRDIGSRAKPTDYYFGGTAASATVRATTFVGALSGNATSATKATQDGSGNTITSYYVTLSTDQTITGTKTFQKRIIAYGYKQATNLPFMTFDKPGSNAAGIGPDGTSNRIKFGPCDLAGTAWTAQSSFNSNQWFFQGSIYGTSTIQTESTATFNAGIVSNHGQNFMVGGNEFNCIPDGYNSTFWFNYETFNRKNNGTISNYYFGDGHHNWNTTHIYAGAVHNAVWNDFAEFRESDITEPGRTLVSNGHGQMILCQERLAAGAKVISDTYGCSVGESDQAKTPLGVAGRVLAYPYQDRNNYKPGDAVCAAPGGTIDIMTREEIREYPDRIMGIVDEIPVYERWEQYHTCYKEGEKSTRNKVANVEVNGRIWIYVK